MPLHPTSLLLNSMANRRERRYVCAETRLSLSLFCRNPDVRPKLILFYGFSRYDVPVNSGSHSFQVPAHLGADNDGAKKLAQPRCSAYRSRPDFDSEAGSLIAERVETPRDVRSVFADGPDIKFVADSFDPVSEVTVVDPAASVMHLVSRSHTWPD